MTATPWLPSEAEGAGRRFAPATLRNRDPIAAILAEELPAAGTELEVASGSGEHCAYFAERFPALNWQPSDPDPTALASIGAWCRDLPNVLPPLQIDAATADWPVMATDAIFCANMTHISPWEATLGLLAAANRLLAPGAPLILYGPYHRDDVPTAASNQAFDRSLKERDSRWGLRSVEQLSAAANGLFLRRLVEMPANNLTLVFRRD